MKDEREELRSMILAEQLHQSEFKLRLRDAHIDSLKAELVATKIELEKEKAENADWLRHARTWADQVDMMRAMLPSVDLLKQPAQGEGE